MLDFTHAAAGPYCTMFLGDMGAEVIKIEKPQGGDGARSMGMPIFSPRDSEYYVALNRNKRSIILDLASADGANLARELVKSCDIVVENFRAGVMDRLGLGYNELKTLRSNLVYASISAYGPTGPWSDRPANDLIMQSVSGLMAITGEVDGAPIRIGAAISDYSSGLFALSGILGALYARHDHPGGQHVEVSMLDAALNMMCNYIPTVATLGRRIGKSGRGHATIVPYQAFMASDNNYVMVGAFTRQFWLNLCTAIGHEEWKDDPRFATNAARVNNRLILVGLIEDIFMQKPSEEWMRILTEADIPNSRVYELHEAIVSEQVQHTGSIIPISNGAVNSKVARTPVRVAEWGADRVETPPPLGSDTRAVLSEVLGLSDTDIDALASRKAIRLEAAGKAATLIT